MLSIKINFKILVNLLNKYSEIFVLAKLWEVKKSELSDLNNKIKINNKLSAFNLILLNQDINKNTLIFSSFNTIFYTCQCNTKHKYGKYTPPIIY